jgi:hypothetical protein
MYPKSAVFTIYNRAVKCGAFPRPVVNRALGIIQRRDNVASIKPEYHTTLKTCNCPAHRKAHICKHRVALMMEFRLKELINGQYN